MSFILEEFTCEINCCKGEYIIINIEMNFVWEEFTYEINCWKCEYIIIYYWNELLLKNLLVKLIVDKYGYIIILLWWTFKSEWIISYIWIYGQNEIKLYILSSKYKIDINVNPKFIPNCSNQIMHYVEIYIFK